MIFESSCQDKLIEYKQRIAFHEAGHAVAICLNNKARNLPPVRFQIMFNDFNGNPDEDLMRYKTTHDNCIARVKGGRFIEILPPSIDALAHETKGHNDAMTSIPDYMNALEADVMNLLIGPLAEAKYVAYTKDELFNQQLVDLQALKNYGGRFDLALAFEYLQYFSACKKQQAEKLDELFSEAFNFIKNLKNWAAITKLASYILESNKNIIGCEEVVSLLECLLGDRSLAVPGSHGKYVFVGRNIMKNKAFINSVELLRDYVASPVLGMQRVKQDGWGRRRH